MAYEPIAAPVHSAAKRLWFNKELKLTKPGMIGASQLNSSVRLPRKRLRHYEAG